MSKLPTDWTVAKLGDVLQLKYGKSLPAKARVDGDVPVFGSNGAVGTHNRALAKGPVIVVGRKGSVGEVNYSESACWPIDTTYFVDEFREHEPRFWYHALRYLNLGSLDRATAIPGLNREDAYDLSVPVPPPQEQKRIADKLDRLLAAVDTCKARLDAIPDILKRFRQSVLAAAVSGELTEEWRAKQKSPISWRESIGEDGVSLPEGFRRLGKQAFKVIPIKHADLDLPNGWEKLSVAELYELNVLMDFADGNHGGLYPRKEDFDGQGVLFLTATQIGENWEVDIRSCPRLSRAKASQLVKGWATTGDVLLTHNATVGRVALLESLDEDVLLGTSVTFYRFNQKSVEPRFAKVLFSSAFFQDQLELVMKQTTRDQVPITKQVSLNFVCPPIEEQREIVRRVEALFACVRRIEGRHTEARAQLERLTQALLARAFSGEFVPQDIRDEAAGSEWRVRMQGEEGRTEDVVGARSLAKSVASVG